MNSIEKAKQIIKKYDVPHDLRVDWDGTNHYECTSEIASKEKSDYFWLDVENALKKSIDGTLFFDSSTVNGQRLGALLELGALFACFLKDHNSKDA